MCSTELHSQHPAPALCDAADQPHALTHARQESVTGLHLLRAMCILHTKYKTLLFTQGILWFFQREVEFCLRKL